MPLKTQLQEHSFRVQLARISYQILIIRHYYKVDNLIWCLTLLVGFWILPKAMAWVLHTQFRKEHLPPKSFTLMDPMTQRRHLILAIPTEEEKLLII